MKQAITNTDEINGATGKAALEMMAIATVADTVTKGLESPWIIAAVIHGEADAYPWSILDGQTYPFLSWESVG